ncbi:MAG: hypothetical protein ACTHJV_17260 [Rhizobiaceae bacterium]
MSMVGGTGRQGQGVNTEMARDFASFLEDLLVESEAEEGRARITAPPSVPFAFLGDAVPDGVSDAAGPAAAAYRALKEELLAEISAPETNPAAIARELGLDGVKDLKSLHHLRRSFAFHNHPDRVRPQWRERAMVRMQIANQMIDETKRRLGG